MILRTDVDMRSLRFTRSLQGGEEATLQSHTRSPHFSFLSKSPATWCRLAVTARTSHTAPAVPVRKQLSNAEVQELRAYRRTKHHPPEEVKRIFSSSSFSLSLSLSLLLLSHQREHAPAFILLASGASPAGFTERSSNRRQRKQQEKKGEERKNTPREGPTPDSQETTTPAEERALHDETSRESCITPGVDSRRRAPISRRVCALPTYLPTTLVRITGVAY